MTPDHSLNSPMCPTYVVATRVPVITTSFCHNNIWAGLPASILHPTSNRLHMTQRDLKIKEGSLVKPLQRMCIAQREITDSFSCRSSCCPLLCPTSYSPACSLGSKHTDLSPLLKQTTADHSPGMWSLLPGMFPSGFFMAPPSKSCKVQSTCNFLKETFLVSCIDK